MRFEWAGATTTEDVVMRPVAKLEQLSYYPELCEHVRRLARQGFSAGDIAERLDKKGYRTPIRRGKFGAQMVGDLMRRLGSSRTQGHPSPAEGKEGPLAENEWWLSELATEVGMPKVTLYGWVRRGWVRARQQREPPRRWIVWADEKELEQLQQRRENRDDFGKAE